MAMGLQHGRASAGNSVSGQHYAAAAQARLVRALADAACYPHAIDTVSTIETHISTIVLTGRYAYKIKKPVELGFLDFSTLEKRRFYCEEEVRLNSRFAPQVYLGVVAITGSPEAPRIGAEGAPIEYAVKMTQFAQDALADHLAARGELTLQSVTALAECIARFHQTAARAGARENDYGSPPAILDSAIQNFVQIRGLTDRAHIADLDSIENWTRSEHARVAGAMAHRRENGQVRECHGDLHLGNIIIQDQRPQPFDCIEFNPALRWIDVMNEVAFVVMDLMYFGARQLAARLLNSYLEATGDYGGLAVLRYYVVYRAMVRAKIALMRGESKASLRACTEEQFRRYVSLAVRCMRPGPTFVVITHGLSGSGKTTVTQPLIDLTGAIRLRSDVERKRMHGMRADGRFVGGIGAGLYRPDATMATYGRLLDLARATLAAGYGVIIDATFIKRAHRDMFRELAAHAGAPFVILDFDAEPAVLRERIARRLRAGADASDADLAVLAHQLTTHEPLQNEEVASAWRGDASAFLVKPAAEYFEPLLLRLGISKGDGRTAALH